MIEKLYNFVSKSYYSRNKYWLFQYRISKVLINFFCPFTLSRFKVSGVDKQSEIVVSLTSFPNRIDTVWMTVATLLRQSKKPYKVILWLSEEQFEGKTLPHRLLKLQEYGLEIRWCDDIKPHKKYFYCMQEYTNKCIVIADDDIFYPENHLQLLWENYKNHSDCIIANKTHHIEYSVDGKYKKYNEWKNCIINNPSHLLVPIGCNGVLYPPLLLNEMLFDKEYIINKVLYTDDLWLKVCAVISGVKVYSCIANELVYFDCIKAGKVGLWRTNTSGINRNDSVWNMLMSDYPEVDSVLRISWEAERLSI